MIDQGQGFIPVYERIYPPGDAAARFCAARHPGGTLPSLEPGAGTGRVTLPLAELVGEVVAVELSPEMLERLRSGARQTSAPVSIVEADMTTYEPDREFGLVLCACATFGLVHSRVSQERLVATWARALAPGGTLVIENHNPAGIEALHEGQTRKTVVVPYAEPHRTLLTHGTLDHEREMWTASNIFFDQGTTWTSTDAVLLTSPARMDEYATGAGLEPIERYADFEGTPFKGDELMFVSVYRRP
ncbi:class I SAM-dependent methyltransferase [Halostreptopolyspora alba]|uniref:Class I SAM-dependent methyltransferase n=1 Tax=Halostreptopolyspora alba TaxID=2487137 RepID=A0A3N0E5P5_9ACTN|nr:class I SAM-dependent methyltransferase [Nocardiopsaceae bacterium YIM 96095]